MGLRSLSRDTAAYGLVHLSIQRPIRHGKGSFLPARGLRSVGGVSARPEAEARTLEGFVDVDQISPEAGRGNDAERHAGFDLWRQ